MSYDIELRNKKTKEVAMMRHPQYVRGGTVPAEIDPLSGKLVQSQQTEASINITYNYGRYYYEATEGDARFANEQVSAYYADGTQGPVETRYGIRGLYGKTPAESIPMLMDMIEKIKNKYTDENGNWIETERTKTLYYKDGIEVDPIKVLLSDKDTYYSLEKKEVKYTISEGPGKDYWEATAANAIAPLQTMIIMATDNLTNDDVVWDGD